MAIQQRIEKYWATRADSYSQSIEEEMKSFKRNAWKKLISDNAGESKKIEALDIGTGPGFFAVLMSELGYNVTAVDCSENMLWEARRNVEFGGFSAQFVKSDVHKLPFLDETFDLVVCRNLVWTLVNPEDAYKEWYRVLKTNGKLLVFDANWYLRLKDPLLQEKYEQAQKKFKEMGYQDNVSEVQHKECEDIAKQLPLTYEVRPEWDKKALLACGFQKIVIEDEISDKVWDELEKLQYNTTPMFSVCTHKAE